MHKQTLHMHRQFLSISRNNSMSYLIVFLAMAVMFFVNSAEARKSNKGYGPVVHDSVRYSGFHAKIPRQFGPGSWYGKEFHNRRTASGQTFDMYGYTAAHRTLPLGSIAKVTSQVTGKSVLVCINDRGPYVYPRIIDLSYTAAGQIGKHLNKLTVEYFTPEHLSLLGPLTFNTAKYFGFTADHQPMIVPLYACTNLEVFTDFTSAVKRHQTRQSMEQKTGNQAVLMIVPDMPTGKSRKPRMPKYTYLVSSVSPELAQSIMLPADK
ncbi:MAG: hypothetical protein RLZZ578_120 [Bacteroidota bacterium]|jgi:rare lipoprotein A (peptidoglycan hydrolase)